MTKEELITKQALQIEEMADKIKKYEKRFVKIHNLIYSIGGPLNDNILQYDYQQMLDFKRIIDIIDGTCD